MSFDSTFGYVISRHVVIDAGLPVYFVHGSGTTSTSGLGDGYLQLRLAFENPLLDYKTVFTGTAPTGETSAGLSTGHATFDWTNQFDHRFGRFTPFVEAGIGNSIPEGFVFQRPYVSYGDGAHFQAGSSFRLADWLNLTASAYDIAPWGTQTIFSRIVTNNSGPAGAGGHGRVFESAHQTTGSSSLAADNGYSVAADMSVGALLDFSIGYSRSNSFDLNTFSFGVGLNMSQLLRGTRHGD